MEATMATSPQPDKAPEPGDGRDNRSENLLPGEEGSEDGRFDVAAEVNLDQQSDEARRVGQLPPGGIADSLPESLKSPPPGQRVPDKE
jgi:hypothetical protein